MSGEGMRFDRKQNIIKDESMLDAFRQGFAEGLVMATDAPKYNVQVEFEGTQLNSASFDDIARTLAYIEHAIQTVGVKVTVEVASDDSGSEPPAISASKDDEVVDAEVVG